VTDGKLEEGATESYSNNFQGRYAMRHEWKGPIECEAPVRGRWGGPPNGGSTPPVKPALDLAFATRGSMSLTQMVPEGIPELGLQRRGKSVYNDEIAPQVESGPKVPTLRAKTTLPDSMKSDGSKTKSKSDDGGCNSSGQGAGALWLSALVLAMFIRRRRWQVCE
jgi:MYXO-CTERM domain-containing protein